MGETNRYCCCFNKNKKERSRKFLVFFLSKLLFKKYFSNIFKVNYLLITNIGSHNLNIGAIKLNIK